MFGILVNTLSRKSLIRIALLHWLWILTVTSRLIWMVTSANLWALIWWVLVIRRVVVIFICFRVIWITVIVLINVKLPSLSTGWVIVLNLSRLISVWDFFTLEILRSYTSATLWRLDGIIWLSIGLLISSESCTSSSLSLFARLLLVFVLE